MAHVAVSATRSGAPTRQRPRQAQNEELTATEKSEVELRLEKALFGDDAGFLDSLQPRGTDRNQQLTRLDAGSDEEGEQEGDDLAGVPDTELFFFDAGTGALPDGIEQDLAAAKVPDEETPRHRQAVWYDSDDDRLTVSLAANTRLRKLRDTEDDDIVNGREYIRRLRRQYERLHPTPDWVIYARKKRKLSKEAPSSDVESDSDVSMTGDTSLSSAQPLADLLRTTGSLVKASTTTSPNKKRKLRPEVIDIQRLSDITPSGPSSIDTLQFHPTYPLLLTGGPSSTLSLYHVSPQPPNPNPLLTSLHLKGTPLHTAAFCTPDQPSDQQPPQDKEQDQTQVILSARRRYFHMWSLSSGIITQITRPLHLLRHSQRTTERFKISPHSKYMGLISSSKAGGGLVNVLSTTTMQWVCSCRIDSHGGIADFDWWSDGEGFAAVGKNGEVNEFSMADQRIVARWWDEGAVGTTTLSCSGDGRWVAIGSSSGIVNVYDRRSEAFVRILKGTTATTATTATTTNTSKAKENATRPSQSAGSANRPKPKRTLEHLTTPVSHLVFSADGQLLVAASRWKKNALRLVHLPSCTVYRNWPTEKTRLGRVSAVAVSRDGGWLAVGSEAGGVRLWEIRD